MQTFLGQKNNFQGHSMTLCYDIIHQSDLLKEFDVLQYYGILLIKVKGAKIKENKTENNFSKKSSLDEKSNLTKPQGNSNNTCPNSSYDKTDKNYTAIGKYYNPEEDLDKKIQDAERQRELGNIRKKWEIAKSKLDKLIEIEEKKQNPMMNLYP